MCMCSSVIDYLVILSSIYSHCRDVDLVRLILRLVGGSLVPCTNIHNWGVVLDRGIQKVVVSERIWTCQPRHLFPIFPGSAPHFSQSILGIRDLQLRFADIELGAEVHPSTPERYKAYLTFSLFLRRVYDVELHCKTCS